MSHEFILDSARLTELAEQFSGSYASAVPFPHAVIDNFLPEEALRSVAQSFPQPREIRWHEFDNPRQRKLAAEDETVIEENARWLLYQLNSAVFLRFLESLTGIDGLISDPYFTGGGLHQIERGGYLKIHADFNRHPTFNLDRRLNLLLYLNEDWKEEYGGHLELWDRQMSKCVRRIAPVFNRCVIFSTTDFSYHGHPEPLACPPGVTRKSLALYYYSNGRPEEELFAGHGTLIRPRPGETIDGINGRTPIGMLKAVARRIIPARMEGGRRGVRKG
jgi:Rps23 Pro-64 3,4-dihydroxylase Tpa1-like proline 4-hydroxylase